MISNALQLKASFYTITTLQVHSDDLQLIESHLKEWVKKMPQFFEGLPIILDLQNVRDTHFNLSKICNCLRQNGFMPIGIQGGNTIHQLAAKELHLAFFSTSKKNKELNQESTSQNIATAKIIEEPVRSGQKIYAKGDLVILGSVSPGAELLAEGHIHVYGKLSGRALAGVSNNNEAYIFCHTIDAELVSIAGYYWLYEDLNKMHLKENVYISLARKKLQIHSTTP